MLCFFGLYFATPLCFRGIDLAARLHFVGYSISARQPEPRSGRGVEVDRALEIAPAPRPWTDALVARTLTTSSRAVDSVAARADEPGRKSAARLGRPFRLIGMAT